VTRPDRDWRFADFAKTAAGCFGVFFQHGSTLAASVFLPCIKRKPKGASGREKNKRHSVSGAAGPQPVMGRADA